MNEVRAPDPGKSANLLRREAQLLTDGLYFDELALALIEGAAREGGMVAKK